MTDGIERFSNRVANYVKYRPDYPREIIGFLESNGVLRQSDVIADVGCGTGISTRLFLENGNSVFGVEPNAAMRAAAMQFLAQYPRFTPVDGVSNATTLPDAAIDLVTAAQAFHWFEPESTRAEFCRILRPGGGVLLMWNERQLDTTPFLVDYEQFLLDHANDYAVVRHENIDATQLESFFQGRFERATFSNVQVFDFDGLKGRMLSASYMPPEDHPNYPALIDSLANLFAKHERNGRIELLYDTNIYFSRPVLWQ
jgi:SAM-dependent methyltransferase